MPGQRCVKRHIGALALGLLGHNDNDTIGGTGTIDAGCSRILENGNALNLIDIDIGHVFV